MQFAESKGKGVHVVNKCSTNVSSCYCTDRMLRTLCLMFVEQVHARLSRNLPAANEKQQTWSVSPFPVSTSVCILLIQDGCNHYWYWIQKETFPTGPHRVDIVECEEEGVQEYPKQKNAGPGSCSDYCLYLLVSAYREAVLLSSSTPDTRAAAKKWLEWLLPLPSPWHPASIFWPFYFVNEGIRVLLINQSVK